MRISKILKYIKFHISSKEVYAQFSYVKYREQHISSMKISPRFIYMKYR